jgi:hypothetical protein
VTGRTLSCLLLMTISAALLGAQSHPAPAFSTPGRDPLTGVPARNTLLQPGRPIPELPRLHDLARHAGTIFSGTVTSVEPTEASTAGEIPAVAVTFHVEHAIRGATATPTFTIREWRGLWNDAPRYLLGQRLLLFLYPSSRLGLTSTVGGPLGRFRMDSSGHVLLNAQQVAAFASLPVLKTASVPLSAFIRVIMESNEARP